MIIGKLTKEMMKEIHEEYKELKTFSLSHHNIKVIENMDVHPALENLNLSHNQIKSLNGLNN